MSEEEKRMVMKIVENLRKPQTNADRIRAMSDEELAMELTVVCECCELDCNAPGTCRDKLLRWLKSEVEE